MGRQALLKHPADIPNAYVRSRACKPLAKHRLYLIDLGAEAHTGKSLPGIAKGEGLSQACQRLTDQAQDVLLSGHGGTLAGPTHPL